MASRLIWTVLAFAAMLLCCQSASAQIIINLPTVDNFNVRTTVMVPDGGQMLLGGVRRGSFGAATRGVPGFSNLPVANRLFKNRGIGQTVNSRTASVTTTIIILDEIESQVMAEANRRAQWEIEKNANLDPKTVQKAKFLSRNIGKRKRHR